MPRPQNAKSTNIDVERRRREQVITQAQTLFSKRGKAAAGLYLCDKLDVEAVQETLAGLPDAAQLHLPSLEAPPTVDPTQPALAALKRLGIILTALHSATRNSPKARPLLLKCFKVIHERWSDITTWITFFIEYTSVSGSTWNERLTACVGVIQPVVADADDCPYQEELISAPATVDILLHLLRLTDPTTGKPAILADKPGSKCVIADLYGSSVMSIVGFQSVLSRLYSLPRRATKDFSQSIVARIRHVLESPRDPQHRSQISEDFFHLISPTALLGFTSHGERDIGQEDFVFEAACVLSIIVKDTVPDKLTRPVPYLLEGSLCELVMLATASNTAKDVMLSLFEGGIVPCLLRSNLFGDDKTPRGMEKPACALLPFLTDSDVFRAAQEGGLNQALFQELEACEKAKAVESIFSAYALVLHISESSFNDRQGRPFSLCCHLKHVAEGVADSPGSEKACGRCRSVFYCSALCQEKDWVAFHSEKCIRSTPHRKTSKRLEVGADVRRDKLAFLEAIANRFLPPLPELVQRSKLDMTSLPTAGSEESTSVNFPGLADTFVNVFDLTAKNFKRHRPFKFVDYKHTLLGSYLHKYGQHFSTISAPRIHEFSQDVQRTPESMCLVAGIFLGQSTVISLCTKMVFAEDAPSGEKYRVVSHVFDACAKS